MSRRKIQDESIRTLTRYGRASYGITLPIDIVRILKWKEKQNLSVTLEGRHIIVKDWKK